MKLFLMQTEDSAVSHFRKGQGWWGGRKGEKEKGKGDHKKTLQVLRKDLEEDI